MAFAFLFFANCQPCPPQLAPTKEDTLKIISEYQGKLVNTFAAVDRTKRLGPILEDSANRMIEAFLRHDRLHLRSATAPAEKLKGFVLKKEDFQAIVARGYSTVSFYFGIKNFTQTDAGKDPEYTLLVVPVRGGTPTSIGSAARAEAFDYVLPCPKECPTDDFPQPITKP